MKLKKYNKLLLRISIYSTGIFSVSLGIVLCAKCGLGISPISSWPYHLQYLLPLSFGTWTMIFHLLNIFIQLLLKRRLAEPRILLQIPIAILFGKIIDCLQIHIQIDSSQLWIQFITLFFSIFFTALGMVCMINMELIQNPPDGTVKLFSQLSGKETGHVKMIYDVIMVVTSCLTAQLFLGQMKGLGIATILSALFVGKCMTCLQKLIGNKMAAILYK